MTIGDIPSASTERLPRSMSLVLSSIYVGFFVAWVATSLFFLLWRKPHFTPHWSNLLIPALLFLALIIASRRAGSALGRDCQATQRVRPTAVLHSALFVSGTVAVGLLIVLAVGLVLHKLPAGVVLLAPTLIFLELLLFSFFIHWALAILVFNKFHRHA